MCRLVLNFRSVRSRHFIAIILLVFANSISYPCVAQLWGTVSAGQLSQPVPEIKVWLFNRGGHLLEECVTNRYGVFQFPKMRIGKFTLVIAQEGYYVFTKDLWIWPICRNMAVLHLQPTTRIKI